MRIRVEETLNGPGLFPMPRPGADVVCRKIQHVAATDRGDPLLEDRSVSTF